MTHIIQAGRASAHYWRDIWHYRELMYFLAWRDVVVRYKQTAIGVAWAVIRPALTMLVFVAFRRMVGIQPGAAPDAILVLAAVLPWQFFSAAVTESSGSLVGNANLISKVYFPRLIVPFAAAFTSLVDFLITLCLLAVVMFWYSFVPDWRIVFLPLFVLLAYGVSMGLGLFLAALNVEYRDFRFIVPFIMQFGLFISPVAFSTADVPAHWRAVFVLNPMVGIIDGFRWSLLGGATPFDPGTTAISVAIMVSFLALGIWYFRRMERNFADVI